MTNTLESLTAQLRASSLNPDGDGSERRQFPEHAHLFALKLAPVHAEYLSKRNAVLALAQSEGGR